MPAPAYLCGRGDFGAIYVSLDSETPFRELCGVYAQLADILNAADIPARRILLTREVTLERVVDLRVADTCGT